VNYARWNLVCLWLCNFLQYLLMAIWLSPTCAVLRFSW
jgi:hypothetical protein